MSFYMATCFDDKVMVASDGAGYYRDGTVADFSQKIHVIEGFPAVIVHRGLVADTKFLVSWLTRHIQRVGSIEVGMKVLEDILPEYGRKIQEPLEAEICVAAMTIYGPTIFSFRTLAEEGFVEPFKLYEHRTTVVAGIENDGYHNPQDGPEFFKKYAVAVMDDFREKWAKKEELNPDDYNVIGGHIDVATVSADGVSIERIHTWDEDEVGRRVSPKAKDKKVVLMAAHKTMNRKQRRAAARMGLAVA